ncbi:SDR family NAD(P)-dependent oxidoreductase [Flavobacterium sp. I3-2]|uniref:SDR family NAD(P)-dependent oxidoreductase n=1 Tax=Flavobacterium sp. I3-2 TaxID=2748319 RepID=UPI0015A8BBC7|nr:SDR family NAD(P)-dependent oxidoreductase [Flavobacterium sp. I3-2]
MKTILITGATSGIGEATARLLIKNNRLILCGRRSERLEKLKSELSLINEVITLNFDVTNRKVVFEALDSLPENFKAIDILINNAGNAHGLATFQDADLDDLDAMIDLNVKGLIYVTKAVLPLMSKNSNKHIINLSSIAGKQVYSNGTTYCASKFAVEALTRGMRLDFLPLGIKVTSIAPGAVETEFSLVRFKGDSERAKMVYKGYQALQAENIAETIAFVINQPEHVQLADITILPKNQGDAIFFKKE